MDGKLGAIFGGTAIAVVLLGLGLIHLKVKKVDDKLEENEKDVKKAKGNIEKAVKDLAEVTPVEIKEDIVRRAIDKAVDAEVSRAVYKTAQEVRGDMDREINSQVRSEIIAQRDKVIDNVDRKLVEEVDRISRDDIVNDVQRKITNMVIDRMERDLTDIRDQYARKLDKNVEEVTRKYREKLDDLIRDMDWQRLGYRIYKI